MIINIINEKSIQHYLNQPNVKLYKLLFECTNAKLKKSINKKLQRKKKKKNDINYNGLGDEDKGKILFNINLLTHITKPSPYICECKDTSFYSHIVHDVFMKGKCIRVKNTPMSAVQTSLFVDFEISLHAMETEDDFFMCHTIHNDKVKRIFLVSNAIIFKCPICLENQNSFNSLIQSCGHCICQACALDTLEYIDDYEKKKNYSFKCPVCRNDPLMSIRKKPIIVL